MPHALFLGSSLATQNRVGANFTLYAPSTNPDGDDDSVDFSEVSHARRSITRRPLRQRVGNYLASLITAERVKGELEEEGLIDRLLFIQSHLRNAIIDIGKHLQGRMITR